MGKQECSFLCGLIESQAVIFPDSKISIYIARTKLQIVSVKKTKGKVNRSFEYGHAYFLSDLSHQKKVKFNFIWEVRPITVWQKRELTHALDWFCLTEKWLCNHVNRVLNHLISFVYWISGSWQKGNFPLHTSSRNRNVFITSMGLISLDLKMTVLHVYL